MHGELPFARLVAERYRTDHHELVVDPDMVGALPSIVRHHGEPFADTSAVPTRYLCELTRRHVTVALSGDAGDETFGGYRRYNWAHVADLIARLPADSARAGAAALMARAPGGTGALAARIRGHRPGRRGGALLAVRLSLLARREDGALHARAARAVRDRRDRGARSPSGWRPAPPPTPSAACTDLDCDTYLPDDILTKVDTASMTWSLEARAPFCDHHVVELGAALPGRWKLRRNKGKRILKEAFADLVPAPILDPQEARIRAADPALAGRAAARVRARAAALAGGRRARGCSSRPRSRGCWTATGPARTTASDSGT